MSDWEKGNAYQFRVMEYPEKPNIYVVSNAHYSVHLKSVEEANMVCNLLNTVQVGNGDGVSRKKLKKRLDDLLTHYRMMDKTFTEIMIVEAIFKDVYEVVFK